jgi:hypothetical protein
VLETEIQTSTYNCVSIVLKSYKWRTKRYAISRQHPHLSNLIAIKFGLSVIFAQKLKAKTLKYATTKSERSVKSSNAPCMDALWFFSEQFVCCGFVELGIFKQILEWITKRDLYFSILLTSSSKKGIYSGRFARKYI